MIRTKVKVSTADVDYLASIGIATVSEQSEATREFITRERYELFTKAVQQKCWAAMRIKGRGEFFEVQTRTHFLLGINRGLMSQKRPDRTDWETGWSIDKDLLG